MTNINQIGASLGATATMAAISLRNRLKTLHRDESGGQGGQIAIISAGLAGIAIAVVAVLVARASGGAGSIPEAPAVTTSFP